MSSDAMKDMLCYLFFVPCGLFVLELYIYKCACDFFWRGILAVILVEKVSRVLIEYYFTQHP